MDGMTNRIENVTIVGGGTAGWLSAIMLATFMNGRRDGPPVRITLIESPNIPSVGVGEATVPGMARLLAQLDIDETRFFRHCNASFKCGVRFRGWNLNADGSPHNFIHPFNAARAIGGGHNPAYHFHHFAFGSGSADVVDSLVPNVALIDRRLGPRRKDEATYQGAIGYSYHLDAALFAGLLRDVSIERGVERILDDVEDVELDETGHVAALHLANGGRHAVEFVLDCTGFRSLILGQAMGEPFEPWGNHLLCDRAIPLQLDHVDPTSLEVCTEATALGAGWVWTVPLFNRVGLGYVFSSAFRSDEEAWMEFREHLTGRGFQPPAEPPRTIAMRVGRHQRSWVGNCVAVGLSGGFIEPLEATAIYSIEMTIRQLIEHFPNRAISPIVAARFNRRIDGLQVNVLEFITMHYALSNRPEPFWRAAREDIEIPGALAENLALWRETMPCAGHVDDTQLFSYWSYIFCLYGKGYFDGAQFPLEGSTRRIDWQDYVARLDESKQQLIDGLPDHRDLVAHIRGETIAPATRTAGSFSAGTVALPGTVQRPIISGLNRPGPT